jgi:pimeloyl-ACP methyl ester carboxylesterase
MMPLASLRHAPGRLVDVGGLRLYLHTAGSGGPVVVHDAALGATSLSWLLVQDAVARVARTCSYDRAGLGWSARGPLPRTAGRIAEELRALLDAAGEPPPYLLVGHSFGGLVMRVFAGRWPELAAGLVLVDPAHPEDWVHPAPKEQMAIDQGVRLCRRGYVAARLGIARLVATLVGVGALTPAWRLVRLVSRGAVTRRDGLWAPMLKLPPGTRGPLRRFWSQAKFYESLGSQIAHMSTSAAETLDAARGGYGDLPLVTISSTDPGDYRLRQQDALARLSTRGRHIVASNSGHWIPLDQPDLVVDVIRTMHAALAA